MSSIVNADPGRELVVPVDRFRPLVERWLAGFGTAEEGFRLLETASPYKADTWRKRLSDGDNAGDVDEFLTAAGLTHLWHTELRDLLPDAVVSDEEFDETCAACGRWIDWSRSDSGVRVELKRPHRWTLWWSLCSLCYARRRFGMRPVQSGCRSRGARVPDELLLDLYERYIRDEVGLEKLAGQMWQRLGYATVHSCTTSVFHAWRQYGWPMRDRWTSKRLNGKHRLRTLGHRIPEADLRKMHALHRQRMLSINTIAKQTYERYGYTSPSSCATAISHAWQVLGLQAHDRIVMTVHASTRHGLARRSHTKSGGTFGNGGKARGYKRWLMNERAGRETRNPFCAGTVRGRPCQHRAMNGSVYCYGHDPAGQAERDERMKALRARSPTDPANLTTAGEIQAELAAYFDAAGGRWVELAAATGYSNTQLGRWLHGPPDMRMRRDTVDRLRRGLAETTGLQLAA